MGFLGSWIMANILEKVGHFLLEQLVGRFGWRIFCFLVKSTLNLKENNWNWINKSDILNQIIFPGHFGSFGTLHENNNLCSLISNFLFLNSLSHNIKQLKHIMHTFTDYKTELILIWCSLETFSNYYKSWNLIKCKNKISNIIRFNIVVYHYSGRNN